METLLAASRCSVESTKRGVSSFSESVVTATHCEFRLALLPPRSPRLAVGITLFLDVAQIVGRGLVDVVV